MTREKKAQILELIAEKLQEYPTVYLTDFTGLSVAEITQLRRRFREAGVEFKVVKNTLLRLAMERVNRDGEELEAYLQGPTAIALTADPAQPARIIKTFWKDIGENKPLVKVALIEDAIYPGEEIDTLASLKSRDELIGDIIGLLLSPIANVVGALQAPGATLAGALQTLAEKENA